VCAVYMYTCNKNFLFPALCFKTGLESGLICYQCIGTHPGCGLNNFDYRWYWGKMCSRSDDRCVKVTICIKSVSIKKKYYFDSWLSAKELILWWRGIVCQTLKHSGLTSLLINMRVAGQPHTTSSSANIPSIQSKN